MGITFDYRFIAVAHTRSRHLAAPVASDCFRRASEVRGSGRGTHAPAPAELAARRLPINGIQAPALLGADACFAKMAIARSLSIRPPLAEQRSHSRRGPKRRGAAVLCAQRTWAMSSRPRPARM
jgi:hypothetical protein